MKLAVPVLAAVVVAAGCGGGSSGMTPAARAACGRMSQSDKALVRVSKKDDVVDLVAFGQDLSKADASNLVDAIQDGDCD